MNAYILGGWWNFKLCLHNALSDWEIIKNGKMMRIMGSSVFFDDLPVVPWCHHCWCRFGHVIKIWPMKDSSETFGESRGMQKLSFYWDTKLIEQRSRASRGYIVTMTEELSEKETKTEDSRTNRGRWRETKKVVERDRFLMVPLGHLPEIYLQT